MATIDPEYAIFPMAVMRITTGMNIASHVGSFAIDIAGRDGTSEAAFAPFTGVIKKKYANGNTVWLESLNPVRYADGTIDYMTVALTHDNNINDLRVGQVISQGVNFYQEGTAGNASGNHIHLGVGRGKFTGTGWFQNKQGYWVINNEIKPYNAFYLSGTEIINGGGYPWVTIEEGDEMSKPTEQEVRQYYDKYLGVPPSPEDIAYYTARDIRELYNQILTALVPKVDEVNKAFTDLQNWQTIKPEQIVYYMSHSKNFLYRDLAYGLKAKVSQGSGNYTIAGDLFGETYYRKK